MLKIVTEYKDMQFLLTAPAVAVDIETRTTAPEGHPASGIKKFGLSYVADIIAIALSAGPEYPTAVFLDVESYDARDREILRAFLYQVLCRDVMVIGHNVLFDLRSIGGHFDFTLPIETRVWDTLPMTRRLLLIDAEASNPKLKKMKADVFEFGLLPVSKKWGLLTEEEENFLDFMKKQRGQISDLLIPEEGDDGNDFTGDLFSFPEDDEEAEEDEDNLTDAEQEASPEIVDTKKVRTLKDLKPNDPIWAFAGGFAPNKYEEKNRILLQRYVAYDAFLSFQIYQKQSEFVHKISTLPPEQKTYSPFPGVVLPIWKKLPQLVEGYVNQLRVTANYSIQGLKVDMPYLEKRIAETSARAGSLAPELFEIEDPTDAFPMYKEITSQLIWYAMILDTIRTGSKYSAPKGWVNWEKIHLDPSILADALTFEEDDSERMQWAEWLVSLDPLITRGQLIKAAPSGRVAPRLDLQLWIYQTCFSHKPPRDGMFLAKLKLRWLSNYYRSNKVVAAAKMVNSKFWKPYYLFVIADWPLYTHDQLQFNFDLGTKSFQKARDLLEKQGGEVDLQALAIEKEAFSCGKKPLIWIFKIIEDMTKSGEIAEHPGYLVSAKYLKPFQELLSQSALNKRLIEYHQHAQRDGRVHTILSPNTQTGRDTSTLPNLQNIDMKAMAGIFIPEDDFTFLELDISNAEVNMSAMVSGDKNLAYAVGGDDYHWYWAKIYWPEETREIIETNDLKRKKYLRGKGKSATFAIPYGAGYRKLASLLQTNGQAAKAIAARIDASFPFVSQKKKVLGDQCQNRVSRDKWLPAYTTLWDGSRVMVDSIHRKIQTYTIWNYQLQGGVAVIIHNAMIAIERMLLERGYKSRLVLNVHDSLILSVHTWEYYNTTVVQEVLQILCSQVPEEKLNGTIPPVDFASETCPSNRFKWGARASGEYPLPIDEFINRWGRWKLSDWVDLTGKSEKDWEAPTWKGPKHEGWTFEGVIEQKLIEKGILSKASTPVAEVVVEKNPLPDLSQLKGMEQDLIEALHTLNEERKLFHETSKGTTAQTPELNTSERIIIYEELMARGLSAPLQQHLDHVRKTRDLALHLADYLTNMLGDDDGSSNMATPV